jgi:hypothetical protein
MPLAGSEPLPKSSEPVSRHFGVALAIIVVPLGLISRLFVWRSQMATFPLV